MIGEEIQFIKSDGTVYDLHSPPVRAVMNMTGWGKPPETNYTTTGPFQHGQTWISYRLNPRTISLELAHKYCSRSEWHTGRSTLLEQMGLNNSSPNSPLHGVLRWAYVENEVYITRDLDVRLARGLGFTPLNSWREWSVLESMEFVADNPIIYDPISTSSAITTFTSALRFPITFPFFLGCEWGSATITYEGTWETYPTITITGPAAGVYIENESTSKLIRLDYSISLGETVTIVLSYNTKTVTNNLGQNLMEYITEDSNLGEFTLQPDPIVTGGDNDILVIVMGNTAATSVTLTYYDRFYGI